MLLVSLRFHVQVQEKMLQCHGNEEAYTVVVDDDEQFSLGEFEEVKETVKVDGQENEYWVDWVEVCCLRCCGISSFIDSVTRF